MRKLSVFNQVSVDGYFRTLNGDISWAHRADAGSADSADDEFRKFIEGNASAGGVLVFGRKTYEQMASFWPTPMAAQQFPIVAKQMNALPKVVFSTTLDKPEWTNTRLVNSDPVAEITRMKHEPGEPMTIMGSGTIVSQLTQAGLIDEYEILVIPVVLGEGKTMFDGVRKTLNLKLTSTRTFRNGKAFLVYQSNA
jgi:dihydrofolate reductase